VNSNEGDGGLGLGAGFSIQQTAQSVVGQRNGKRDNAGKPNADAWDLKKSAVRA
jgi:hypothetical protein